MTAARNAAIARVLENPIVRTAMETLDIPTAEIRLADGTSWIAGPLAPRNGIHPTHTAQLAAPTKKEI